MARIDPPFVPLPVLHTDPDMAPDELLHWADPPPDAYTSKADADAEALARVQAQPWPVYLPGPGRWGVEDTDKRWPQETDAQWIIRCFHAAEHWAKEDATQDQPSHAQDAQQGPQAGAQAPKRGPGRPRVHPLPTEAERAALAEAEARVVKLTADYDVLRAQYVQIQTALVAAKDVLDAAKAEARDMRRRVSR